MKPTDTNRRVCKERIVCKKPSIFKTGRHESACVQGTHRLQKDDKDGFRDLDKVKCFNWDAADLFSEKPARLLYIYLEDYRQCPKDYVLTAITASNAAFRNVDNGKCSPLRPPFHIDYEHCVTVNSDGRDGGTVDKWRPWRVQCPTSGPQVAVSLHRRRRIHTGLKCCVLKGLTLE
ncbi:hypothetical protein AVEN_71542-1 [Araneus ventricosus]|uniref:Uncharacterized protein n=1 Tax=Araneus ventricosus TaxID=182803 RepID=A0A4Y2PJU1_ARAVE|nr:hypothetical protein AVEN_71542-1 [Araneus ventricosus]